MYDLSDLKRAVVPLGKRGEEGITTLQFDLTAWLAINTTGIATIHAIRPTESESYAYEPTGVSMNIDGTTLEWLVDSTDTEINGRGYAEVYLTDTGVIQIYGFHTSVEFAVGDATGVLTDPRVLTTAGDLLTFTTVPARIAIGAANSVLTSNGSAAGWVAWSAANIPITDTGSYYGTDNVNAALQEIGADFAALPSRAYSPNILHNASFRAPVNQRAVSGAIAAAGYFYDRWKLISGTVTTNANYLTMANTAVIEQRIEGNRLGGRIVAVSVMIGDTIYSGTGTFPATTGTATVTITGFGTATLGYAAGYMYVRFTAGAGLNVQAVKLEVGAVSTFTYDPPTDYGVELAKCQRFLLDIGAYSLFYGYNNATTTAYAFIPTPVTMRIDPTIENLDTVTTYDMDEPGVDNPTISALDVYPNGIVLELARSGAETWVQYAPAFGWLDADVGTTMLLNAEL